MHPLLEKDKNSYKEILSATAHVSAQHLETQARQAPGKFIPNIEMQSLPTEGLGASRTIDFFEKHYAEHVAATAGPRYFGFVTGGSTPASIAGDWLVSAFDQNACGSNDSIAPQIEKQTIHFFKQMFGLDAAYFGTFVTGATMSNFVSLAQARQWIGEQHGMDFSEDGIRNEELRVISATPHSSILKSLSMLGIGRKALMKVATLPGREAIDMQSLEKMLAEATRPVIVVANVGTVNTVDFDDLAAIGKLKTRFKFWLHVDAAFGGFAALSPKYKHLVDGINYADSITIDAHKWLNVPYDAAMQFTRHQKIQLKIFQNSAAYLGDPEKSPDYFHYTPENSRRWRALPSWFTLMAYGIDGHREIVERNCKLAMMLGNALSKSSSFTLLAPVRMNVVCFTLADQEVSFDHVQRFLKMVRDDGRVFFTPTLLWGKPAIRAAISNWQTEEHDIAVAIDVLESIAKKMRNELVE
ncbi:MAG TPA: pyridoxal-dependent decarboxylase [Chryseosolibacter sp.]|nr:pyridoxal-dependent decarboxylase [Chryseosolibacter sp.]